MKIKVTVTKLPLKLRNILYELHRKKLPKYVIYKVQFRQILRIYLNTVQQIDRLPITQRIF